MRVFALNMTMRDVVEPFAVENGGWSAATLELAEAQASRSGTCENLARNVHRATVLSRDNPKFSMRKIQKMMITFRQTNTMQKARNHECGAMVER